MWPSHFQVGWSWTKNDQLCASALGWGTSVRTRSTTRSAVVMTSPSRDSAKPSRTISRDAQRSGSRREGRPPPSSESLARWHEGTFGKRASQAWKFRTAQTYTRKYFYEVGARRGRRHDFGGRQRARNNPRDKKKSSFRAGPPSANRRPASQEMRTCVSALPYRASLQHRSCGQTSTCGMRLQVANHLDCGPEAVIVITIGTTPLSHAIRPRSCVFAMTRGTRGKFQPVKIDRTSAPHQSLPRCQRAISCAATFN